MVRNMSYPAASPATMMGIGPSMSVIVVILADRRAFGCPDCKGGEDSKTEASVALRTIKLPTASPETR